MCLRTERILSVCLSNRPQSERTVEERKLSGIPEKYFCIADFLITFASRYRGVEQLAARWAHNPKVGGSSPPPATQADGPKGLSAFSDIRPYAACLTDCRQACIAFSYTDALFAPFFQ